jgi:hypothetical protein
VELYLRPFQNVSEEFQMQLNLLPGLLVLPDNFQKIILNENIGMWREF